MKVDSELFRLLTRMQDEVHRFAITFHRQKRSKRQTKSELDTIPGVGAKTKELLIKTFGSVKRIKEASLQQLQVVVGYTKGQKLFENLHSNKENHE